MNDAIDSYVPSLPAERWEPIAAFVREAARDCEFETVYTARNLLATASKYVDWCYRVCGKELERTKVFTESLITEYADLVLTGVERSTAGNYRSRLRRMAEVLNPGQARVKAVPIPPSKGVDPYTPAQTRRLWAWAHGLDVPRNSRDALILLAGGLGAGLTAREVCDVHGRDVHVDAEGVVIDVTGARPREVPVVATVERIFIDAAQEVEPDDFVFRPGRPTTTKNTASMFIRMYSTENVRPSTQRLRATWAIEHLRRGVPIQALMKAMGVQDFSAIARYLRNVPDLDEADFRARLRAESGQA